MSTKVGRLAEGAAALWLQSNKFGIVAQNWRNRWCEIDIVAKKNGAIHFVEVKYRKSEDFGGGFEYITADKIMRLKRAAQAWLADRNEPDAFYHLDVISVSGTIAPFTIEYLADAIED